MNVPPTRSKTITAALMLGIRSMLKHPGIAVVFLLTTLTQGTLQGLLVISLQQVLLSFSGSNNVTTNSLILGALLILAVWTLRAASTFAGEVFAARLAHRVEIETMIEVISKLLTLSVRFFDKSSQGDLVMSSYYDLKGIRSVTLQIGRMILYLTRLGGLGVAAWLISPKLAFIGLVAVPLGALPAYWIGKRITEASQRGREAVQTLYDTFLQINSGIRVIKVNLNEDRMVESSREIGWNLYKHLVQQVAQRSLARFLLEAVSGLGIVAVIIFGANDVAAGRLDWPSLLGMLVAVMAVYAPVVGLIQIYGTIRSVIPNLDRVDRIMHTPADIRDQPDARPLTQVPETIELCNISFAYENQTTLEALSATFRKGETIGIVGPSGSGKSTLMSLLLRFYDPTRGTILFDGVDLRQIKRADLMNMSAIVLQEPFLFADTVATNIRMGRPDASMEEVVAAAKDANIHDEILEMEHGYNTVLGKGSEGRGVSGGQRQRICIAAALLKNSPLLFLDEATSSLDSVSEQQVQSAIDRLMHGRTTFVIAHRLSTLRNADRIIVLNQGKMAGLGTHDELLLTCPTYQTLWRYQEQSIPLEVQSNGNQQPDTNIASDSDSDGQEQVADFY